MQQGDVDTYMKDFLHYGMTNRTHSSEIELVLREIEEMKVTEKYVIYNYDTIYSSPWAPHIDYEQRHRIITEVKLIEIFEKLSFLNSWVSFIRISMIG